MSAASKEIPDAGLLIEEIPRGVRNFDPPAGIKTRCKECRGQGYTDCPDCDDCFTCDGERFVDCEACDGKRACSATWTDLSSGQAIECGEPATDYGPSFGKRLCADHTRQHLWQKGELLAPSEVKAP